MDYRTNVVTPPQSFDSRNEWDVLGNTRLANSPIYAALPLTGSNNKRSRESPSEVSPLTTSHSEGHDIAHLPDNTPFRDTDNDTPQRIPDNLTCLTGAHFLEHPQPNQYASSVTTNASLPLPNRGHSWTVSTSPDRDCQSDIGDYALEDTHHPDNQQHRLVRSVSPVARSIHLWQRDQDDWKTHRPAHSIAHARRRRKHGVRQSLNRVNAAFPMCHASGHDGAHAGDREV